MYESSEQRLYFLFPLHTHAHGKTIGNWPLCQTTRVSCTNRCRFCRRSAAKATKRKQYRRRWPGDSGGDRDGLCVCAVASGRAAAHDVAPTSTCPRDGTPTTPQLCATTSQLYTHFTDARMFRNNGWRCRFLTTKQLGKGGNSSRRRQATKWTLLIRKRFPI